MSIYQLKSKFQSLLRPIVNSLAAIGITANQVTIFAVLLSVGVSVFLFLMEASRWWVLLPVVMFVRMALNAIDGMLAREHNMLSNLGFVLNEVGDLVSDAAMYMSFIAITGFSSFALFAFVLLSWISEIVAILSLQITKERSNEGPMGKSDRAFIFGLLGLLVAVGIDFSLSGFWVLLIASMAVLLTIFRRLKKIVTFNH